MGGGSYEIELMPQKEMTEVAGLKPGLETWKLYSNYTISKFILDQSLRPEAAASF